MTTSPWNRLRRRRKREDALAFAVRKIEAMAAWHETNREGMIDAATYARKMILAGWPESLGHQYVGVKKRERY